MKLSTALTQLPGGSIATIDYLIVDKIMNRTETGT